MRVRHRRNQHLYTTMISQRGSGMTIPMYRASRRFMRGGGFGSFFKGAMKALSKPLLNIGKEVIKDMAPAIAKTGAQVLSGKTTLKKAMKATAKETGKSLSKGSRRALEKEIDKLGKKQKGGNLKGKNKLRGRTTNKTKRR